MPAVQGSHTSMTDNATVVETKLTAVLHRRKNDVSRTVAGDESLAPKKRLDKQSLDYLWRTGVAGGFAGCAAKTFVAPLDRVKILFQAHNPQFAKYTGSWAGTLGALGEIYRQDGLWGLYKGHSVTLLRVFPYAGIKFLAYEQIRAFVIPRSSHETPFRRFMSGSLAGATSVFFTYPLEVVRVRLAFETKREGQSSMSSICRQIYNETPRRPEAAMVSSQSHAASSFVPPAAMPGAATVRSRYGIANFYRGFSPTMLGMLPYAGMSFLTHDTMGDLLRLPMVAEWTTLPIPKDSPAGKPAPLRSSAELFAGGVAGLVSQTVSYPLEVIRRRMQVGGAIGDGRRLRMLETAALIMKEKGPSGFFVGLTIGYVKVVPMVAISFYTYERFKMWLAI